jgi:type IV secretory pathway protease TraF
MSARTSRRVVVIGMLAGVAFLLTSVADMHPLIVWNSTASAPIGFYRLRPVGEAPLRKGELVLVWPDAASAQLYAERGYLPLGVPLLKRIAATSGQGRLRARGHGLDRWSACRGCAAG